MNVYFDNIINNIPLPNGVSSKSAIDLFINEKDYFSEHELFRIPEIIRILKNEINSFHPVHLLQILLLSLSLPYY